MEFQDTGERKLQAEMGSSDRALRFYDRQLRESLTETMISLIRKQEMVFVATADARGNCDCSPRFGNRGFVFVLDEMTLAYPEYRGNGVYASLGNIVDNPSIGLVFIDFFETTVGLHVNGKAHSYPDSDIPPAVQTYVEHHDPPLATAVERWVVVTIEEAYIHCSKHVPLLAKMEKPIKWGTDDPAAKSSDYFADSAGEMSSKRPPKLSNG